MTPRLDYQTTSPNGMKALGGVYGYILQSGLTGALFSEREKAALAWAETVTRVAETAVPDEEFAAVSKVFSEQELTDLTIAIGLMNSYNRLGVAFRTTPEAAKHAA